jgi:hypothetical protein
MNEYERKKAAERIFDSLGMIDDTLIAEAENYSARRKTAYNALVLRRFVAVAAVVVLISVGSIGSWIVSKNANSDSEVQDGFNEQVGGSGDDLRGMLQYASSGGLALKVSSDALNFFDGRTKLIWQYEGESDYYVVECDRPQKLKNEMSKGGEQISFEDSKSVDYKVWVSYGNGEVVTPHLKEATGNVGYAELFDYSPEIIPNEGFEKVVNETVFN